MKRADVTIEDLLPHRGRMMLINEILEIDEDSAVTVSVVTDQWPMFDGKTVSPIVLIELIAQTAGISNGLERIRKNGKNSEKKGWLVGIKKTRFFVDAIPLHTRIITRAQNRFKYDGFREILGTTRIGKNIVCETSLQVVQADSD
jgi:predicted hotdog family 3-hydroxylacyl-ACP dehydratase